MTHVLENQGIFAPTLPKSMEENLDSARSITGA